MTAWAREFWQEQFPEACYGSEGETPNPSHNLVAIEEQKDEEKEERDGGISKAPRPVAIFRQRGRKLGRAVHSDGPRKVLKRCVRGIHWTLGYGC
jgi:hypothetical protein